MPQNKQKRALIVVDVQAGFVRPHDEFRVPLIRAFITRSKYDMYVECVFHAEKGSIWDTQLKWTFPFEPSLPEIQEALAQKKDHVLVIKETKSGFKGDKDLVKIFKDASITHIDIIGFDANDCVLATAFDAFDAGFHTKVLAKYTGSSEGDQIRSHALAILKHVSLLQE